MISGISSQVHRPSDASSYIDPLLSFAAQQIPEHKHKETPLYILATAGMRMLSVTDQEAILDDLRVDVPLKYNFHFTSSHVEVITGKQEGKRGCIFSQIMLYLMNFVIVLFVSVMYKVHLACYCTLNYWSRANIICQNGFPNLSRTKQLQNYNPLL